MNVEIKMPDLATTDSDVTIVRWLIEVGQQVQRGQPLLEIETDKATMEVESIASGTLREVFAGAGDQVAVGQVIANVESEELVKVAPIAAVTHDPAPVAVQPIAPTITPASATNQRQSLFARNKAKRGLMFTAAPDRLPLTANQREVGRRMLHSKQTIPHFYLTTSANAESLAARREAFRQQNIKLAWDAFFVLAAARSLQTFDKMTYRLEGDTLIRRSTTAIGVAVDIDDALYVIAIDDPLNTTLEAISRSIEAKVAAIRQGDPAAKRMTETCLSITNLGAENIETFQAVINPPETAILAIGKVTPTVIAQGEQIMIQKRVAISLSVDHRVINGKYAAKFLSQLVKELEAI
jgi:pyruvate dehydrogenase E2 component (dihydrolipoamide acetyltransferase)